MHEIGPYRLKWEKHVHRIPAHLRTATVGYGSRNFESLGRDSAVGIATGYGLDDGGIGVRVPVGSRIFSSPRRPDRLWVPPNLLSSEYRGGGAFLGDKAAEA
jgi:hypothetical protein